MSWEDAPRRMLPPTDGFQPHTSSPYGAIRKYGTSPHGGVDGNYYVGPNGQQGINLRHPALRSPVDGIVTNAGEGTAGRIAIRDADGVSHELLHTHRQFVSIGDRVVAGQMVGAMGNMGAREEYVEKGDHHLHYQLIDAAGGVSILRHIGINESCPLRARRLTFRSISGISRTLTSFLRFVPKMCGF
jgi:murein DD-endopeptidase MepM/ murein hydrolase activator NlpD